MERDSPWSSSGEPQDGRDQTPRRSGKSSSQRAMRAWAARFRVAVTGAHFGRTGAGGSEHLLRQISSPGEKRWALAWELPVDVHGLPAWEASLGKVPLLKK